MSAMQQQQQAKAGAADAAGMQPQASAPRTPAAMSAPDKLNAVANGVQGEDSELNRLADLFSRSQSGDQAAVKEMADLKAQDPNAFARRYAQMKPMFLSRQTEEDVPPVDREMLKQGFKPGKAF